MSDGQGSHRSQGFADVSVSVENMGGITAADLAFSDGVTVFTGENATNRTSLLRAIAGALGGTAGQLKRDADAGSVELTADGERYTRRYSRADGTVRTRGDPYTDEETIVDLFVCLLEDNPIRRAVRAGDELADLLLAPVDTDELERRIADLQSERDQIDTRLTEIEREGQRLPKLEERRRELRDRLGEIESELESVREADGSTAAEASVSGASESLLEDLERAQEDLQRAESEIKTQRSIRDDLKEDLLEVREELSDLEVQSESISRLEREIDRLQGRESELSATINELSTILKQNRDVLSGDDAVVEELAVDDSTVDDLDPMGQSIDCWTCGSRVTRQAIAGRLEDIEALLETKRTERDDLRDRLSELRSDRDSLRRSADRRRELEEREAELERELDRRTDAIDDLTSEADALRDEIADLQASLESMDVFAESDDLSIYERVSELEYERGQIEQELRDITDDVNEIEYLLGKRADLEARRGDVTEQITTLRTRVEEIETETVETFNTHIESVIDRLDYGNVERVWLERRKVDGETTFDLHVVREDESGRAYEDEVDHLSESEREVVGLVVALAGYLAHEVRQSVPVILLDSLEAIDANRIAELVAYFRSHTDCLLLALLEEDASALPAAYDRLPANELLTGP